MAKLKVNQGVYELFFLEVKRWNWASENKRRFSMFIKSCSNFFDDEELKELQEIITTYVEKWGIRLLDAEELVYKYHWGTMKRYCRRKIPRVNRWGMRVWDWRDLDIIQVEEDLMHISGWCRKVINAKAYDLDIDFTSLEDGSFTGGPRGASVKV
jgi:hypothetical protein